MEQNNSEEKKKTEVNNTETGNIPAEKNAVNPAKNNPAQETPVPTEKPATGKTESIADNPSLQETGHTAASAMSDAMPMSGISTKKMFKKAISIAMMCLIPALVGLTVHYMRACSAERGNSYANVKLGDDYMEKGEKSKALEQYEVAAELGNLEGMYKLALIKKDKGKIEEVYKILEKIDIEKDYRIGGLAQKELGDIDKKIYKDSTKAFKRYKVAAEKGKNEEAMFLVGRMYEEGDGVKRDYEEALVWYKKVAEKGHKEAQSVLAEYGQ